MAQMIKTYMYQYMALGRSAGTAGSVATSTSCVFIYVGDREFNYDMDT